MRKRIAILAFDGVSAFHLSVPHVVFGENREAIGLPAYDVSFCAVTPGLIRSSMGFALDVQRGLDLFDEVDLLFIPSWGDVGQPTPPPLLQAVRAAHRCGVRIVGLCLGAFVVAEAGLLDGRSATTHWGWAAAFAERFPRVELDPHVLYIDHGDVVTSAGTAAGLDCCLHLLRQEVGAELANSVARRLVIPPHRQGGQAQYVEQPAALNAGSSRLSQTLEWALGRIHEPLGIDALAGHAAMSRRTFTRHFQKATGMGVVAWLAAQRLCLAQRLLESSDLPIEEITGRAGFGSPLSLRLAFAKALDTTPSQYRREFRSHAGAD